MFGTSQDIAAFAHRASALLSTLILAAGAQSAPVVFSSAGTDDPASIQATVDDFRAALGEPNNGNAPGPLPSGRREINWDGGGATAASPGGTPFTVFTSIRGGTFTTPGTGFLQTPLDDPAFTGINAAFAETFSFFSPLRIFTPLGSNITDATFSIPGTDGATPAAVSGFGAIFSDVDLGDTTSLELFDARGLSLGTFFVEPGLVDMGSLSFLGITFTEADEAVARVRITTGNVALGDGSEGPDVDFVVMDDFFYGEPQAVELAVSEPASLALALIGLLGAAQFRRRGRG